MITAIRNKKRQQAMVIFPEPFSIFMNGDIAANGGIEFSELLNSEENLCMGRAVQSNVSVALINSDKLLSSVDFMQEFIVALGVETESGEASVRSDATLGVKVGDHVITATASQVYFDSTAYSVSGTPAALFVYEDTLFVIGDTGTVINAFTIGDSAMTATDLPDWNAYMLGKCAKWAANGTCLSYVYGVMHESAVSNGVMAYKTSLFAPLGHFVGSKPDKVKTQIVSLSGDDLMQRFDQTASGFFDSLEYPMALGTMFTKLCDYCGVIGGDTSTALNMDRWFSEAPIDNDVSTCREVLAYIAEAAGCYARMSRYGFCELVWFSDVDYTLNRTDYFSIDEAEYTVQRIDKVQSKATQDDIGVIVGDGTNGYDIINNPYLSGTSEDEIRPWVENIYDRLSAFEEYSPITVSCESNWLLRCGDIITVETEEGSKRLPIFAQTISWAGNARASIQSTGEQTRGTMTAVNNEKLVNARQMLEIKKSVDGLSIVAVKQGEDYHTAGVSITADGIAMNTDEDGSITATVGDETRLLINKDGVKSPLVTSEEIRVPKTKGGSKYVVIAKSVDSTENLWKGSIQLSIDALPKYLTQDTELTIPAGVYEEDVEIRGFYGSRLRVTFASGAKLNGSMNVYNCSHIVVRAATLGNGYIYPRSAETALGFYAVTRAQVSNMYISGYRGRTSTSDGSDIALYFNSCHALVQNCCLEYANKGMSTNYSVVCAENTFGGQSGTDATTNANLKNGILASSGSHVHVVGTYPMGANDDYAVYRGVINTYSLGDATAGGMEYVAPTEFTKSFTISKHCTYMYGVSRKRDDSTTGFYQGFSGTYTSGTNNWRMGAIWFADAVSELAGKTILSAKLTLRRATNGWSNPVNVYLGTVELTEDDFTSTLKPTFTQGDTYPIGQLAHDAQATFDVTDIVQNAIPNGYALGAWEKPTEFSGSFSPAYSQFYGKGSSYEPVLTVTYK